MSDMDPQPLIELRVEAQVNPSKAEWVYFFSDFAKAALVTLAPSP